MKKIAPLNYRRETRSDVFRSETARIVWWVITSICIGMAFLVIFALWKLDFFS